MPTASLYSLCYHLDADCRDLIEAATDAEAIDAAKRIRAASPSIPAVAVFEINQVTQTPLRCVAYVARRAFLATELAIVSESQVPSYCSPNLSVCRGCPYHVAGEPDVAAACRWDGR